MTVDLSNMRVTYNNDLNGWDDLRRTQTSWFPWGDNKLPSNGNQEHYEDRALSFNGTGQLLIHAFFDSTGWVSGLLTTSGHSSMTYGYSEVNMRLPPESGFFGAGWMLPYGKPYGELDFAEQPNVTPNPNDIWQGSQWGTGVDTNHTYQWSDIAGGGDGAQFHAYGVGRDASGVTFYVDRQPTMFVPATAGFKDDENFFFVLNLQVGDRWSGAPTAPEAFMVVDRITTWESFAGPDSIRFGLFADTWGGAAHAEFRVDGRLIGAKDVASSDPYAPDYVTFSGLNLSGSGHQVSVSFTNDAWGGAGMDRNLYVGFGVINESEVRGDFNSPMYSNGTVTFNV